MRVAFVGPAFHKKTQSSQFLLTLLYSAAAVDVLWDPTWYDPECDWLSGFVPEEYNCIIIYQWSALLRTMRSRLSRHPNVVVVPMLDHTLRNCDGIWTDIYRTFRVLCFSAALYSMVCRYTRRAMYVQYFPSLDHLPAVKWSGSRHGYLWQRIPEINEQLIALLTNGVVFDSFTVHWAPDPKMGAQSPSVGSPIPAARFRRTSWYSSRDDYIEALSQHNIFFAPRLYEGIGMAFLEAMALGMCVVAPNTPTHNEYIRDRWNGLLYSSAAPLHLSEQLVRQAGLQARESLIVGRDKWLAQSQSAVSFLLEPERDIRTQ